MTISSYEVQAYLSSRGFYDGNVDGVYGRQSMAASLLCITNAARAGGFKVDPTLPVNPERHRLGVEQIMMTEQGFYSAEIDGFMGPAMRYGYDKWDAHTWRTPLMEPLPGDDDTVVSTVWPLQREMEKVYGKQGQNLTKLQLPFPMRLAWNPATIISSFSIHEMIADSALRVFDRILDHYGVDKIIILAIDMFGGCLANPPRPIRGGSAPSTHNWAAAIDFDPEHNQLRWSHSQARFAHPEYAKFWQLWEEEGWLSLGRSRDFDWMHVQAARI